MNRSSDAKARASRANAWGFAIVFIVVNLHVLRNVALMPYLAVYAVVSLWVLNRAIARLARTPQVSLGLPTAWIAAAGIAFASTLAISGAGTALYGLSRYLFALPVLLAFIAYTDSPRDLLTHIRTMCVFFAVGALTVPLQYLTGPITFFADSSERAGLERYASVFGSLTALGIAAGSYIALAQALRPRSTVLSIVAIGVGGIASLSKAAIVNIALGLASHLVLGGRQVLRMIVTLAVVLSVGYLVVQESAILQESLSASATSFGVEGGSENYDMSFQSSLYDRLVTRPAENWAVLATMGSSLVYVTGGGFGMASTALVSPAASLAGMTHNQFAEFFSVAGLVGGSIATLTVAVIVVRLVRARRTPLRGAVLGAMTLWVANAFFANGIAYQPITASVLFLAMFVASQRDGDTYTDSASPGRTEMEMR
ncbi:hypothetical protein ACWDHH_01090 [Janibacter hoylei]